MQRYCRLKNTWILLIVSITLHAEACLFTDNKFGLFFSLMPIYIQKIKVKYEYFQEIMTIKEYSNPRAFWGMCSHACSKVIDCVCFFHLYLSTSKKIKVRWIHPFKRHWRLRNSNVLIALAQLHLRLRLLFQFSKKKIN